MGEDALIFFAGWPLLVALGCLSGFLSGLLGIGGGTVLVPALILSLPFLGIEGPDVPKIAMATSLAVIVPTAMASAQAHASRGAIDGLMLLLLGPSIVAGSFVATLFVRHVDSRVLIALFILFCLYAAGGLVRRKQAPELTVEETQPGLVTVAAKGLIGGSLASVLGLGVAWFSVPIMTRFIPMQQAIGTASALCIPMAIAGIAGYIASGHSSACGDSCVGYIYLPAVAAIGISAVLSAPIGAWLAHILPVLFLSRVFAGFLAFAAINLTLETLPLANLPGEARKLMASLKSTLKAGMAKPGPSSGCPMEDQEAIASLAAQYGPHRKLVPLLEGCPKGEVVSAAALIIEAEKIENALDPDFWEINRSEIILTEKALPVAVVKLPSETEQNTNPPLPEKAVSATSPRTLQANKAVSAQPASVRLKTDTTQKAAKPKPNREITAAQRDEPSRRSGILDVTPVSPPPKFEPFGPSVPQIGSVFFFWRP